MLGWARFSDLKFEFGLRVALGGVHETDALNKIPPPGLEPGSLG